MFYQATFFGTKYVCLYGLLLIYMRYAQGVNPHYASKRPEIKKKEKLRFKIIQNQMYYLMSSNDLGAWNSIVKQGRDLSSSVLPFPATEVHLYLRQRKNQNYDVYCTRQRLKSHYYTFTSV